MFFVEELELSDTWVSLGGSFSSSGSSALRGRLVWAAVSGGGGPGSDRRDSARVADHGDPYGAMQYAGRKDSP